MFPEIDPSWFLFRCPECRRWFSERVAFETQPVVCPRCGKILRESDPEDPNDDLQWKM